MQITHEEARRLIHLDSDETLTDHRREVLDSHLSSCSECQNYADSIQKMESILGPLLQRQWIQQPVPLPIDVLLPKANYKLSNSILLATRITAIGVMFVVFLFSAWQFALSRSSIAGPMPASAAPIPIASTSTNLVSTKTQSTVCENTTYLVQENDTLASIATRFSTSEKEIMITNNMKSELIIKGMKMIIPVCDFTPTANVSTITFTPMFHTITSTPGG